MKKLKFCYWCAFSVLFVLSTGLALGRVVNTNIKEPAFVQVAKLYNKVER